MKKDYEKWHRQKQKVNNDRPRVFFKEREVWFCYLGENVGFEQDGRGGEFVIEADFAILKTKIRQLLA